ncbi:SpvB/TcaC N-terminal domain-containing protein [Micromonospora sonneratiae]|uniref:SpvB/TcaC N-terminal domain-containing protein n=1 Tax=Micromonospora sonneratiae TaxID=1184706 RepID=A0ABW3YHT9_9ACTN
MISLPKGGGAISGLGEKFAPDMFTGTGTYSVPIALPPGRLGLTPQLSLEYSTGAGNGPFGVGWQLSLPGVARRASRGVPRYSAAPADRPDVYLLSGAEDLVPVAAVDAGRVRFRPRTEGTFARVERVLDASGDFWEVRGRDGLLTTYGTPRPTDAPDDWRDPAAVADPADPGRVFAWRITRSTDPLGNLIRYEYLRDEGQEPGRTWDQPLVSRISYADYGDRAAPSFLVTVEFEYEARPDPFSDHRAGFEIRTSLRCRTVRVVTHAADGVPRTSREYRLTYTQASFNGTSLLHRIDVVGIDDPMTGDPTPVPDPETELTAGSSAGLGLGAASTVSQPVPVPDVEPAQEFLPPMTFGYTDFQPENRRFEPLTGNSLPTSALNDSTLELVDVRGIALPDFVELGSTRRFWRNAGDGRFELPRPFADAPPVRLGEPGIVFADADGDGRPDLVVTGASAPGGAAGYFPLAADGGWSRRSFQPYRQVPSVGLTDPGVRLIDLDGDGLTDVVRSGSRLECWFNDPDPRRAWQRTLVVSNGPPVDLADPRVRLADMTGDGLADIVLLRSGNVSYWPSLGHGRFGAMVTMRRSPRLPDGYDPNRLLLGDLDGDGVADLVYVDDQRVLLWGNRCGNGWTEQPVVVSGTPRVLSTDSVRLADLRGTGFAGVLFTRPSDGTGRPHMWFLDVTGGRKPYLLESMDNNLGAVTKIYYNSSTAEYLRDAAQPATRWRTTLPFPVQVVSRIEITDQISQGRVTSEFRYHHGYWDGFEREFRGFAMVEQFDTDVLPPAAGGDVVVPFSPPTLTKRWFHPGPVAAADDDADWTELDLRHEYWSGDAPMLARTPEQEAFLASLSRPARRSALRAMRGNLLRSELYALDGTDREALPVTVTESLPGVREESPPLVDAEGREHVFFPFTLGNRTTQWERGDDPMTQTSFPAGYDAYGLPLGQVSVAVPRGRDPRLPGGPGSAPYLATYDTTEYARRDDSTHYIVDRVSRTTTREVVNDGALSVADLAAAVLGGPAAGLELRVVAHTRTHYDGAAFVGLPLGQLGEHGLPVRAESLAFTDDFLDTLHGSSDANRPAYLSPDPTVDWPAEYPPNFRDLLPELAGYRHYGPGDVPGSPGGYYRVTSCQRYDVHDTEHVARGLPIVSLDALGAPSRVTYDPHDLLPIRVTDAAGLTTVGVHDYRVLQLAEVTDANGNTESVTYSPAGLVTARYRRGRDGAGDQTLPSVAMEYDVLAFMERGQPASVRTVRRVHHDSEVSVPLPRRAETVTSVDFSDGFGRLLQSRAQAEDTQFGNPVFGGGLLPLDQSQPGGDAVGRTRTPSDPDNVIVSGWQIYDNKGRVVHRYEPFYDTGYDYSPAADSQLGQRVTMFYDAHGRVIRTVQPDGSQQRVVFGVPVDLADPDVHRPTPWESFTYDGNDNAGRTHPASADGYSYHWNTPASAEVDALGRTVRAVVRNARPGTSSEESVTTLSRYDIQGNLVAVVDALGREAFRYVFDLIRRRWRVDGIDSGRRDVVFDALDGTVESRDSKGALTLTAYDMLHRPTHVWARDAAESRVTLRQLTEYGDGGTPDQPAADRAAAQARNLLGRAIRQYDEAGLLTMTAADFNGNILETVRRVICDAAILDTYRAGRLDDWRIAPFQVDWTPSVGQTLADREAELLETHAYAYTMEYDALGRTTRQLFPLDVEGRRRELASTYDRAGRLASIQVDGVAFVRQIAYDAKGKRVLVAHGNGLLSRYAYDPHTFHLVRMRSDHYTVPGEFTYRPVGEAVQDYGYAYDLVGNVVAIFDRTPGSGIRANPEAMSATDPALRALLAAGDALDRRFVYDAAYRLLSATGREHLAPPPGDPWRDAPRGSDHTQSQPYTEAYTYDAAGNLVSLEHRSTGGGTRTFEIGGTDNRMRRMTVGKTAYDYAYDVNGNLVTETASRHFAWNHRDQLVAFATQVEGVEPSVHAQYLYDATGQRVKKLVRKQGGAVEVTHYLAEVFEHHRWPGLAAGENNQVYVNDGTSRIASQRIGPAHPDDRGPAVAIQLDDHLGSSNATVDDTGKLTNREEFTPYGETSFGSYTRKRYRFTGEERDEESGLSYHSARYLAPWLGRWVSCDPAGPSGGVNLYAYVSGNPLRLVDPSGLGFWDRVWGGVKAVGGALETAAGAAVFTFGMATSELGIGVPIMALGAVITAHGVDTTVSGARTVYEGSPVDSVTAGLLQDAGMSRRSANLVDAGIGAVFSLGSSAFCKAPTVASAASGTEAFVHLTSPAAAAAINTTQTLGKGGGTIYVGSTSLATASKTTVALKTGLTGEKAAEAVKVPASAAQALRTPVPIGPGTLWQRLSGTQFSKGAGSINLSTGAFTQTGVAWTQWKWSLFDAWLMGWLRATPALGLPGGDATSTSQPDPTPPPESTPSSSGSLMRMRKDEQQTRSTRSRPDLSISKTLSD